jgi:hypothetical protein
LRNSSKIVIFGGTKMLSPASSQQWLLSDDSTQQNAGQSKLEFVTAKKCDRSKPKTNAKVIVSCVNCKFEVKRDWQGWIIGKGITGSLNAFLTRLKNKSKLLNRNTPLMRLLTLCGSCCIELDWDGKPDQDHILSVGNINEISASLVLSLSYKEVEAVVSSREIIMEGVAMNAIKTVGIHGEWKEWPLLNKP